MSTTAYSFTKGIHLSAVVAIPALLTGLLAITQPAQANTYVVTNISNSGSGSLRQAITDAKNNPGTDTISFSVATNGTPIILAGAADEDANASGDLDILDGGDLILQGNGIANTIIDGGGTDRVLHVCPGGSCTNTVTLTGLVIRNGSVTGGGGGISNHGTLNIQSSIIGGTSAGNTADYGGGIFNSGFTATLNVQSTTIVSGNTATIYGGGIYNSAGTVTVNGSTVRNNGADCGGGIYNWEESSLNIQNGSTIGGTGGGNTAITDGGGIYNEDGTTTVDGSIVSANDGHSGGGIFNKGDGAILYVQNGSTIGGFGAGNTAQLFGGGIYNEGGTTTVDDSTVSVNNAFNGAGIYNMATLNIQNGSTIGGVSAGNGPCNEGGGINNWTGTTTVDDSTVSANIASYGGGIFNHAILNVQNGSTIGGAGMGNSTTIGDGAGIINWSGTTTVDGSAVQDNTASGGGGGISNHAILYVQNGSTIGGTDAGNTAANGPGGGIYNKTGVATVDDSTVSANRAFNGGGGGIFNAAILYVQNGSTIGGTDAGNATTGYGGGICNNYTGMTTVSGSRILNNTATNGGGVYNDRNAAGVTSVTDSCVVGNSATSFLNNQSPQQYAFGNWWGAATGPNTPGADTVGGNVATSGYLTKPILGCGVHRFLPGMLLLLLK